MSSWGKVGGMGIVGALLIGGRALIEQGCRQVAHHPQEIYRPIKSVASPIIRDEVGPEVKTLVKEGVREGEHIAPKVVDDASRLRVTPIARRPTMIPSARLIDGFEHTHISSVSKSLSDISDKVSDAQIIGILPGDEEAYKNVFRKPITAGSESELRKASATLSESGSKTAPHHVVSGSTEGPKRLYTLIDEIDQSHLIILVGHSDSEGSKRVLRLPNGVAVSLDLVTAHCHEKGKQIVIITCYSELTPDRPISLTEGMALAERLIRFVQDTGRTRNEIFEEAKRYLKEQKTKKIAVYAATTSGSGFTIYYASIKLKEDRK